MNKVKAKNKRAFNFHFMCGKIKTDIESGLLHCITGALPLKGCKQRSLGSLGQCYKDPPECSF